MGWKARLGWNNRKSHQVSRLAGYATNPVRRKVRVMRGREQTLEIGGHRVQLPPENDLPFYLRRDPTYDTYAAPILRALARTHHQVHLIDVGANVGDTAAMALTAAANISVTSVEGAPRFAHYARRNLSAFGPRAEVIEGFVGPVGAHVSFRENGTTGSFHAQGVSRPSQRDTCVSEWVSPQSLVTAQRGSDALVVWKSDVDGFDIAILANHWEHISTCPVIWFEYDPTSALVDPADVQTLIELIGDSGMNVWVFDNLGRRMVTAQGGEAARSVLASLTQWQRQIRDGFVTIPYFDVWLFQPWVEPQTG